MSEPPKNAPEDDDEEDDSTTKWLKKSGIPVTRQSWIDHYYDSGTVPKTKNWTKDHEAELPQALQDWSLFKSGRYTGPPIDEAADAEEE